MNQLAVCLICAVNNVFNKKIDPSKIHGQSHKIQKGQESRFWNKWSGIAGEDLVAPTPPVRAGDGVPVPLG